MKPDQLYCLPALVAYHAVTALLAFGVARYGERLLDAAADGYRCGVEWLEGQVL